MRNLLNPTEKTNTWDLQYVFWMCISLCACVFCVLLTGKFSSGDFSSTRTSTTTTSLRLCQWNFTPKSISFFLSIPLAFFKGKIMFLGGVRRNSNDWMTIALHVWYVVIEDEGIVFPVLVPPVSSLVLFLYTQDMMDVSGKINLRKAQRCALFNLNSTHRVSERPWIVVEHSCIVRILYTWPDMWRATPSVTLNAILYTHLRNMIKFQQRRVYTGTVYDSID